jgi:hypothetical protein
MTTTPASSILDIVIRGSFIGLLLPIQQGRKRFAFVIIYFQPDPRGCQVEHGWGDRRFKRDFLVRGTVPQPIQQHSISKRSELHQPLFVAHR